MLQRRQSPNDRRGVELVLTPAGVATLRRMRPIYASVIQEHFVDPLDPDEAAVLRDALSRVREGI